MAVAVAVSGCFYTSSPCGSSRLVDCGGYCADLYADELDCGQCGAACAVGDYCSAGLCVVGSCFPDGSQCGSDWDCCSDYCASDGLCGCIPGGFAGCLQSSDCCSGYCGRDGVCR
jgi:hypothetical protein